METAVLSSLKLKNDWMASSTYEERNSFENQKRVWDGRISAVMPALVERISEHREQYLKELKDMKQECQEWERAYQERKKKKEEEEKTKRPPRETAEEIIERLKKQAEERIQRHCPPIPALGADLSTSSGSNPNAWKYLREKLGDFKDFILGDSPQKKTKRAPGIKELNGIHPQSEERKHPIKATATVANWQPKNSDVRPESNPGSMDDHPLSGSDSSNAAIPGSPPSKIHVTTWVNPPLESPTAVSRSLASSDLTKPEVCQCN